MIHPNTRIGTVNAEIGYGVFATAFIPKGTVVYIKDPLELEISPSEFEALSPLLQNHVDRYSYIDENGIRIVSWDHGKYVNHCCQCNTISTGYGFEIAIRDILPGEEITDEYALFKPEGEMTLQCTKPGCRKVLKNDDFKHYSSKWDEQIKSALSLFHQVDQPLTSLMDAETLRLVNDYLKDPLAYRSVLTLFKFSTIDNL